MNRTQDTTPPAAGVSAAGQDGFVEALAGGRVWRLSRPADLESLWEAMGQKPAPTGWEADERLPYWVELWPAAVLLARHIAENPDAVRGRACVDAGCGLGLSTLAAAFVGGRVVGFDYEPEALVFARRNAALNLPEHCPPPVFAVMDWRRPGLARGGAELVFGADILYERRFFEPVEAFLRHVLAPGGRVWIADPERAVSAGAAERLEQNGWRVTVPRTEKVMQGGQNMTVRLLEITRYNNKEG